MKRIAQLLSWLSLVGLLAAAFAYAAGRLSAPATNHLLLAGSLLWLVTAPLWMKHQED